MFFLIPKDILENKNQLVLVLIRKGQGPGFQLTVMGMKVKNFSINCGKFWKRWEYKTTWPAFWESCMKVREQQLELYMEPQTGSK